MLTFPRERLTISRSRGEVCGRIGHIFYGVGHGDSTHLRLLQSGTGTWRERFAPANALLQTFSSGSVDKRKVADMDTHEKASDLKLYRIGGLAGLTSGVLGIVANALHPRPVPANLGNNEKFLELVSGYELWRIDHLMIVFAVLLGLVAFVALARSMSSTPAAAWARVALAASIATGAVAAVSFSIDGYVLAAAADEWLAASGDARSAVVERFAAIAYIDMAIFSVTIIGLFGATPILFGAALWGSGTYARWIGATALAGGVLGLISGCWIWLVGGFNVGNLLVLFTAASVLFTIWIFAASLRLLSLAKQASPSG